MKHILTAALATAYLFSGTAQAKDVATVWTAIQESAPRSVFDEIRESAPRSVFDQLNETAPRDATGDSTDNDRIVGE
jgi:hypothetical protein